MTDGLRTRVIAVLNVHGVEVEDCYCDCGRDCYDHTKPSLDDYAGHVADAILAIPGIAVVELPEPDYEDSTGYGWLWCRAGGVYAHGGKVYDEEGSHTPAQARAVAANWLAAADYAERDQ